MTSSYLLQPLRTELQARIDRMARKIMAKYPASTWFARQGEEHSLRFLAISTMLDLERENEQPAVCEVCQSHDSELGDSLCADCRSDARASEEAEREYWQEYRGPRYWRSL